MKVTPPTQMRVDAIVNTAEALEITGTVASLSNNRLRIKGLPEGLTGSARIFNPATESASFAGDFIDNSGNNIRSAVFSKVEHRNEQGDEVHDLGTTATLEMEVPADTWRVLRDMQQGDDRIQVPVYSYNPQTAVWDLDGNGYLINDTGKLIAESELPSILEGTFQGRIISVASVTHFSSKNIDFPTAGKPNGVAGRAKAPSDLLGRMQNGVACALGLATCIPSTPTPKPPATGKRRKLGDYKWKPKTANSPGYGAQADPPDTTLVDCPGAEIRAQFYFPDGVEAGHYYGEVEADGTFSIPVRQSEADGIDLDENGVAGEKLYVRIFFDYGDYSFHLIEGPVPEVGDQLLNMGDVDITEGWMVPAYCEVTGTVQYRDGSIAAGVDVDIQGSDALTDEQLASLCPSGGCVTTGITGADGSFTLGYPFVNSLRVGASFTIEGNPTSEWYSGAVFINDGACPVAPITVKLIGDVWTTPTLTQSNGTINWDPALPVWGLFVTDSNGNSKWRVTAATSVIVPPVTYGVVPSNATEEAPAIGSIESGDYIQISGDGTTSKGDMHSICAYIQVP